MAEVQKTTESGETTQLFIQFVMMQQQQALLALGKHPTVASAGAKNLTLAKMFIDQLGMIRQKTAGNLQRDEEQILSSTIQTLQTAYLDAMKSQAG